MLVASSTKYTPLRLGVTTSPKRAPLPGGEPLVSSHWNATCAPAGVVSTMRAVACVDGEDVAVRREGQAERRVEPAVAGHVRAGERGAHPGERVGDCGDAVVGGVGDVQRPGRAHSVTRRPDHQRCRIGPLRKAGADHGARDHPRGCAAGGVEHEPDDGAAIDHCAVCGDRAIEHVGDEDVPSQRRDRPTVRSHGPLMPSALFSVSTT